MGMTWDPALTEPGGRTRRLTPQGWFVKPGSVSAVANPVTRRPRWPRSLTWRPPNAAGGKP